MNKPLCHFSDKCLFCGDTFTVNCYSKTHDALMAYRLKIEAYVKHRLKCSAEYFAMTETKGRR
jgi:hypothetical protein